MATVNTKNDSYKNTPRAYIGEDHTPLPYFCF